LIDNSGTAVHVTNMLLLELYRVSVGTVPMARCEPLAHTYSIFWNFALQVTRWICAGNVKERGGGPLELFIQEDVSDRHNT
jgi:hypothetical protein